MNNTDQQLGHDALDPLTGLAGPEAARDRLADWLARGNPVHSMMVGLRRFDALNLAYGSRAGDHALVEAASRLRQFAAAEFEGPWLAARFSGSRFLLLATEPCSRERWQLLAGQLGELLARPISSPFGTMRLSPRIAMIRAILGQDAGSAIDRQLLTLEGLTAQSGRRSQWADGEAAGGGRTAAQLEADLLHALEHGEIEVLYQPQFSCADDHLSGAEALARWNHPEIGRIGAGALFAIAERADQVAPLSKLIARDALNAARKWPGDLRLSLNVTPGELGMEGFAAQFRSLVKHSHFAAWRLTIEVTEQVQLIDIKQAALVLTELAAAGIRIALDDFGAGFCNFRYLKLLPLHYLKLDRSMIEGPMHDGRVLAVLRAIVATARALDLQVIAEGVESEAQRALVALEGCSSYQGFLRASPLSADEFLHFARS